MERTGRPNVMSGGAGGGRGGGGTEEAIGLAKETRRRCFSWREPDPVWRTTLGGSAVFGGRPLRGGLAAWVSSGV